MMRLIFFGVSSSRLALTLMGLTIGTTDERVACTGPAQKKASREEAWMSASTDRSSLCPIVVLQLQDTDVCWWRGQPGHCYFPANQKAVGH